MSITNFGIENNTHECQDCGMRFYNSHELVNHSKKFCTASGLNSLQGLAQYEHGSSFSKKLKNYGAHSLGSMKYQQNYNASQLAKQAKQIQRHKEQLSINRQYTNNINKSNYADPYKNQNLSNLHPNNARNNNSAIAMNENVNSRAKYGSKVLGNSQISIKSLNNFGKEGNKPLYQQNGTNKYLQGSITEGNYYSHSPPTSLPSNPFAKHVGPSVLDKSNSSIAKMSMSQKRQYATDKLLQLDNIAEMYDKSGGMSMDFRKNIDKMRKFYKKMLEDDSPAKVYPGEFAESRVQTPISKLRDFQDDENQNQGKSMRKKKQQLDSLDRQLVSKMSGKKQNQATKNSKAVNQQNLKISKKKQHNNNTFSYSEPQMVYPHSHPSHFYPPFYPTHQSQPQIIMMPPYPAQSQSSPQNNQIVNEQIKYFQRMIQMKNEENKKLMKMLMDTKRQRNPSKVKSKVQQIRESRVSMMQADQQRMGDLYIQTPMNQMPTTEQKILMALQRQQLDQLRLLSTLPQQLQQLKMESVMKLIEQRTQLQKQILKQKVRRLEQQQKNQIYEQQVKLQKDQWANQQRKILIGHQMNDILNQFRKKVHGEDSEDDYQDQYEQEGQENEGQLPQNEE